MYENKLIDKSSSSNVNLKYLCGINNEGEKIGVTSLLNLVSINMEFCDILNFQELENFENLKPRKLVTILFNGNKNILNQQIYKVADFLKSSSELSLPGNLYALLDNNKEVLDFSNSDISDLSFLSGNIVTKSLTLSNCKNLNDENITPVGTMVNLEVLNLDRCVNITNFEFLYSLENLKKLSLKFCKISDTDLENLSCESTLTNLRLGYCSNIRSLDFLDDFPFLSTMSEGDGIDMRGWGLSKFEDLSSLNQKNFKCILLQNGDLSTMQDAISNATEMYGLVVDGSNCSEILKKLEDCSEMTYLRFSAVPGNGMYNDYGSANVTLNLSKCQNLQEVYFYRSNMELINLSGCKNLSKVTINDFRRGSRWEPIDFSEILNLNYLSLQKNYMIQTDLVNIIEDLVPVYSEDGMDTLLSGAPHLNKLILSGNQFVSLAPFSELSGKTTNFTLDVSSNNLIDLKGIENLTQLTELNISNNLGVTNVQPILDLKSKEESQLNKVTITGCTSIQQDQKDKLKSAGIEVIEK